MRLSLDVAGPFVGASEVQVAVAGVVSEVPEHNVALTFLWIAVILLAARFSSLIERLGQPSVLGELAVGVVLGNLVLLGIQIFEPIKADPVIAFLAELGVVILLFQVGLESDIQEMLRVGPRAFLVACVGVFAPFILGAYVVGPWLLPGLSAAAYVFLGATLTATSIGITARVFRDLGRLQSSEARIVLGAAVADDILGLIILAVVSAIVTVGAVSLGMVGWIVVKAVIFLVGAVVIGQLLAPTLGRLLSKIDSGTAMKLTLVIGFALILAYLAESIGLAPILGAFAAGLALDPVHFRTFRDPEIVDSVKESMREADPNIQARVQRELESHARRHVEYLIEPIGYFLVPIFFVATGMAIRLETFSSLPVLLVALGLTIAAIVGKVVSGLVAGGVNKMVVGWGMVPRGEVGLIFAAIGRSLGVFSDEVFSVIIVVVILTTFITPPVLNFLIRRQAA